METQVDCHAVFRQEVHMVDFAFRKRAYPAPGFNFLHGKELCFVQRLDEVQHLLSPGGIQLPDLTGAVIPGCLVSYRTSTPATRVAPS